MYLEFELLYWQYRLNQPFFGASTKNMIEIKISKSVDYKLGKLFGDDVRNAAGSEQALERDGQVDEKNSRSPIARSSERI